MKHIVYTCLHCHKQETEQPDKVEIPPEWAKINYERCHMMQEGEQQGGMVVTTLETHACGDCAKRVLDYLEPPAQAAPRLESV